MGNHYPLSRDLPHVTGTLWGGGWWQHSQQQGDPEIGDNRQGGLRTRGRRMMAEGSKLDAAKGTTVFVFFQKLQGGVSLNLLILTLIMQNTRKCIVLILSQRSAWCADPENIKIPLAVNFLNFRAEVTSNKTCVAYTVPALAFVSQINHKI